MMRVLRALWRASVAEELQYRANFVASLLGTVFWTGTAILTVAVFFGQTDDLGGWTVWEVVALLGIYTALGGLVEAVIRPGLGSLVSDVRSGGLDLVLARPVEAQIYVSFRRIDIWRFADVVLGLGLTTFALVRLGRAPGIVEAGAFLLALIAAAAVVYAIWVVLMSTAFWFVAVENLAVVFDALYEAARYPVAAYPGALRLLFVYLIPIAWTTTIPAGTLTGRFPPVVALGAIVIACIALFLSRLFWLTALRHYTSAGG